MNPERMRWLREVVEAVSEEEFDMDTWSNECGTVRCAGGWLCADPRAQAAGLTLEDTAVSKKIVIPSYRGLHSFNALATFLGIPLSDACRIFNDGEYRGVDSISRARVLKRIDSVIKKHP